jgi:receptor protein-tyrosine kinase
LSLVERIVRGTPDPDAAAAKKKAPTAAPAHREVEAAGVGALQERSFVVDLARLRRDGVLARGLRRGLGQVRRRLLRELGLLDPATTRPARARRLLITSAHPGEGKTFTALNLALSLAVEEDLPTLLFDADTARSHLGTRLDLPAREDGEAVLYRADNLPFAVLPPFLPRAQLKSAEGRRQLLEMLERVSRHDPEQLVIVDSPPLAAMTDAAYAAQAVDHVLLVVGAGMSTPDDVAHAVDILGQHRPVSLLLNRASSFVSWMLDYSYADYRAS